MLGGRVCALRALLRRHHRHGSLWAFASTHHRARGAAARGIAVVVVHSHHHQSATRAADDHLTRALSPSGAAHCCCPCRAAAHDRRALAACQHERKARQALQAGKRRLGSFSLGCESFQKSAGPRSDWLPRPGCAAAFVSGGPPLAPARFDHANRWRSCVAPQRIHPPPPKIAFSLCPAASRPQSGVALSTCAVADARQTRLITRPCCEPHPTRRARSPEPHRLNTIPRRSPSAAALMAVCCITTPVSSSLAWTPQRPTDRSTGPLFLALQRQPGRRPAVAVALSESANHPA